MADRRVCTFGDLINSGFLLVSDGYRAKNEELGGDGPIFLRAAHVTDSHIDLTGAERFHSELAIKISPKLSRAGDIVVTTKGNSTGRVAFVDEHLPRFVYSPHLSFWRSLDESFLYPGFLRYWSRGREFRDQLNGLAASTDMAPYLSLVDQRRLRISLPEISEQQKIALILSSLDDKIDLNRRMNETLEAIARGIFKSWFVDSTSNGCSRGWREGRLGDVAENPRRGVDPIDVAPSTPYIGLEHMPRRSIALAQWGYSENLASGKFSFFRQEILFGKLRPYFHKVGIAPIDGVCSTDILVLVPKREAYFGLVLGHVSSDEFVGYTDRSSAGTKMPRTNWADMARYEMNIPPDSVASAHTETVRPMIEKIISNIHESRTLAALRDTLLPKLLSGEIRVKEAEKVVGEAV
jgi:type I restriction enzyme, S subunit